MSRFWTHISATAIAAIALAAGRATVASAETPAQPQPSATQRVTVERPEGQIVVSNISVSSGGRLQLTVNDTRDQDPGWAVSVTVSPGNANVKLGWKPSVQRSTPEFTDSDGTVYSQQVDAGPSINPGGKGGSAVPEALLGSAPPGHGLGIAVLGATLTTIGHLAPEPPTLTVTIV